MAINIESNFVFVTENKLGGMLRKCILYQQASPFGDKGRLVRGNPPETPVIRKEEIIMHDIILFVIGAMAGGFVAAAFLCALQINRNEEEEHGEA